MYSAWVLTSAVMHNPTSKSKAKAPYCHVHISVHRKSYLSFLETAHNIADVCTAQRQNTTPPPCPPLQQKALLLFSFSKTFIVKLKGKVG